MADTKEKDTKKDDKKTISQLSPSDTNAGGSDTGDGKIPPKKEKTFTVTKKQLKELATELVEEATADMKELISKQNEEIALLRGVADQARLNKADAKRKGPMVRTVCINTYTATGEDKDRRVIVGWKSGTDIVQKNTATGVWTEIQTVKLMLEDVVDPIEVRYEDFTRILANGKVLCDVQKREVDEESGSTTFTLKRQDTGRVLQIDSAFVN